LIFSSPLPSFFDKSWRAWNGLRPDAKASLQIQNRRRWIITPRHIEPHDLTVLAARSGIGVQKSGKSRLLFDFTAGDTIGAFMLENPCTYWRKHSGRHNLAGETGLRLWYGNLIQGLNHAKTQATGFTYTLEFVTTLDGHIKPSAASTGRHPRYSTAIGITLCLDGEAHRQ
jgi:hypothetical protein